MLPMELLVVNKRIRFHFFLFHKTHEFKLLKFFNEKFHLTYYVISKTSILK